MLSKLKNLFKKNEQQQQNVRYAVYQYVQSRTGRWRWQKKAELGQYIEPNQIEDYPEDGYYQMREISPQGTRVLWTVLVEGGEVVEYDPELPSNIPIQQGGQQQQDPMASIQYAIQYLKMQKQLLEELGLIKDPKKEMLETLTMLKELEEIKSTAASILSQPKTDIDDAPWWAKMLMGSMQMLPQLAQMQQMQMMQYQQPMQPMQQFQPQQQQQQEEDEEIDFEPPSVEEVKQKQTINKAQKEVKKKIEKEAEKINPELKIEPKKDNELTDFDDLEDVEVEE